LARYGFLLCKNGSQQIDFKGQKMDVKLELTRGTILKLRNRSWPLIFPWKRP
jgi:hypothetical protein